MIKMIQDYYKMFDARTAPLPLSELAQYVDMADLKAGLAVGDLRLHRIGMACGKNSGNIIDNSIERQSGRNGADASPKDSRDSNADSGFFLTLGHDL